METERRPAAQPVHRFLSDKPQIVNPAYPAEPAPVGRLARPDDVVETVDLERYGVAARGWSPFWQWFRGIFHHEVSWWKMHIPFLLVLTCVGTAAVMVIMDHWRRGAVLLGSAALLSAIFRAFLPSEYMELLEVRSQRFDTFFMLIVATILLFLVVTVPS